MKFDIGINIDLDILTKSRLLVQANSGAGKSYALRKLLETTNGKIQQIVIDIEGEFSTLREKYDFVLFGSEGDYPLNIKYADKIARTLLELNVSAILDLYEKKHRSSFNRKLQSYQSRKSKVKIRDTAIKKNCSEKLIECGNKLRLMNEGILNAISKTELGEQAEISSTSGTFGTYIATLKRNGLITVHGQQIKLAEELGE